MTPEDRRKMEDAAGVSFHDDDEAESLVDCVRGWWEAVNDPDELSRTERLKGLLKLRPKVRELGADVKSTLLLAHDDSGLSNVPHRQWPVRLRRELVGMVLEVWREHGGKGTPSLATFSDGRHDHDGPVVRLITELFRQAGIPAKHWPSSHTIHDDIRAADQTTN